MTTKTKAIGGLNDELRQNLSEPVQPLLRPVLPP